MRTIEIDRSIEREIIPFESRRRRERGYEELLKENTELLEETAGRLFDSAINLAANGAWTASEEEQPEGSELELDPASLLYCPDERVRRVMLIWQQVMDFLWDEEVGSNP